ncbi:MAG: arsenate reductase ArsC [Planctomycetaceae bacterium]
MNDSTRKRVLFLCTGNSCRSQMAEGYLRELRGDRYESLSAGAKPAGYVNPLAIEVMHEDGIDISDNRSKSINEFLPPEGNPPDLIVAVCDTANENCPIFPAAVERISMPFDDPFYTEGTEEQVKAEFRRVRDEIKAAIEANFN